MRYSPERRKHIWRVMRKLAYHPPHLARPASALPIGAPQRNAQVHHRTRDEQQPRDEPRIRARGDREAEPWECIVEHYWVDHGTEGRASSNEGHGECAAPVEVLGKDSNAGDVDETASETGCDALAEDHLRRGENCERSVMCVGGGVYLIELAWFDEREHE